MLIFLEIWIDWFEELKGVVDDLVVGGVEVIDAKGYIPFNEHMEIHWVQWRYLHYVLPEGWLRLSLAYVAEELGY